VAGVPSLCGSVLRCLARGNSGPKRVDHAADISSVHLGECLAILQHHLDERLMPQAADKGLSDDLPVGCANPSELRFSGEVIRHRLHLGGNTLGDTIVWASWLVVRVCRHTAPIHHHRGQIANKPFEQQCPKLNQRFVDAPASDPQREVNREWRLSVALRGHGRAKKGLFGLEALEENAWRDLRTLGYLCGCRAQAAREKELTCGLEDHG